MPVPATLSKRIGPVDPSPITSAGAPGVYVHPRIDEVLLYLTNYGDEREYEAMMRLDTAISGAAQQRISGVVEAGSEVLPGKSGKRAARLLRDFAISYLKRIPALGTLAEEMQAAIYYGWRPVELQWGEIRHKSRPYVGVVRAVARNPWDYEVTIDGQVVRMGWGREGGLQPPGRFLVCTSGSTGNPYGNAWLRRVWALYHLSSNFDKLAAVSFSRALGLLKAVIPTGKDAGAIATGLAQVRDRINSYNIIVEPEGWALEFEQFGKMPENLEALLRFLDERKRIALVGQNLSTEVRGGSFAAARAHMDVLNTYQRADARRLGQWMNDGLIAMGVGANYGEVDPDDAPRWQSRLLSRPDAEDVKLFFDLGGPIDGNRLAETLNVPAALPEDGEPVVLQKVASPPAAPKPSDVPARAATRALTFDLLDAAMVPAELRELDQWVCWRYEDRGAQRPAKIHYAARGGAASASDPATWASLAAARAGVVSGGFDGVAFALSDGDPYCGVDLDDCLDESGEFTSARAEDIVRRLATYTEISPSGRGVKAWCRAELPPGRRRTDGVEMYDQRRFFTVTGRRLAGAPSTIRDCQAEVEAVHAEVFGGLG